MLEQSWCESLLNGILVEIQGFCAENYTKVVTSFQKSFNNSWFRQKSVLKLVLHMYHGVRGPLMEKSYFAQNWTYTLFALSGRSLCYQPLPEFWSNPFETLHWCYKCIEDVHVTFCRGKNNFWQSYGIFDLDKFKVSLQHRVASLCNQLLPGVSSNQFETLHKCYKHIEDVHVTFCRQKIIFDKIMAFLT